MKLGPLTVHSEWRDYRPRFRYWNEDRGLRYLDFRIGPVGGDPLFSVSLHLPDRLPWEWIDWSGPLTRATFGYEFAWWLMPSIADTFPTIAAPRGAIRFIEPPS